MTLPIVHLENVSLEYTARKGFLNSFKLKALDNITFDVNQGEIFGVLGNNGSGKSTLLKVLSGVLEPDSGSIRLQQGITRSLLALGLGFNNQLSGRDNALISCMLNGLSKKQAKEKLEHIKEFSELNGFFEQPVKTYSSGMRSKLGFAAGLILDVDILLIDEVLSVGDQTFRKKAESALLEKMKGHQTVIFVSHNAQQIAKLCDRCLWLEKGKLQALGNTQDVLEKYHAQQKIKQKDK